MAPGVAFHSMLPSASAGCRAAAAACALVRPAAVLLLVLPLPLVAIPGPQTMTEPSSGEAARQSPTGCSAVMQPRPPSICGDVQIPQVDDRLEVRFGL